VETCTDPLALAVELRNLHRSQKDFAAADRVREAVKAATGLNMKDWPFGSSVSAIEIVTDTGQA
jgi:cysteinyl-tRNA synthetase